MYLGQIVHPIKTYRSKYIVGIGSVPSVTGISSQTFERYQCDACGKTHDVLGKATESFYCRCNVLISID